MALLIGVTGELCSGKDTVAKYLETQKEYAHISLSNILREDLQRQDQPVTRENLQHLGNVLRQNLGPGILAERALGRIAHDKQHVITSIGTVGEIKALRVTKNFKLIFVDAPPERRYAWFTQRARGEEPPTREAFDRVDRMEKDGGGQSFREFDKCRMEADLVIDNDGTLDELYASIDKALRAFEERPGWDDYFFGIMDAVSQRATCDRGKAATIIVKDKRILATGYVGSPKGLPHCDEVGHLFEKTLHAEGQERWHCVRTTHSEQNAIAQAALRGIPVEGATLYTSMEPCFSCAKLIINAGIAKVICRKRYHGAHLTRQFFTDAGVDLIVTEDRLQKYAKM